MRRRSLLITVFCLGEIVFAVQLIIQAELVKSEVKEWNDGQKALPDVKTRCVRLTGGTCCNDDKILEALRKPYDSYKKAKRNGQYLEPVLYPLTAIVGANALAAIMFNSGTYDLTKVIKKSYLETCIKGMAFMLWCICWFVEIGIGGFVLVMIILAKTDFIPANLQSLDLCKNSGQTITGNMTIVKCFRKLKVCPTTEEQTLIASLLLGSFIIVCAVFKIGYRFFLNDDDTERFECPNCCLCPLKDATDKDKDLNQEDGVGDDIGVSDLNTAESRESKRDSVVNDGSTTKI